MNQFNLGVAILVVVCLSAGLGPFFYPAGPWAMAAGPLQPPFVDLALPLGSDMLGRDILAGILYGARSSLTVGFSATLGCIVVGCTIGAIAGFYGGVVDEIAMRMTEVFQTMPALVFTIVIVAVLTPSLTSIVIAIVLVGWAQFARVARGEYLRLRNRPFILGAITSGLRDREIMIGEILPNALPPILVLASLKFATAVLTESGIAFLGLGDPHNISWGYMIGSGRSLLRQAWWISVLPGIALILTAVSIHFISETMERKLRGYEHDGGAE